MTKADLRRLCSYTKLAVCLISTHKDRVKNSRRLCHDVAVNDLPTNVIDKVFIIAYNIFREKKDIAIYGGGQIL